MSRIRENTDDIARIDAIEATANAAQITADAAEPADSTILKDSDINNSILAPDGDGSSLQNIYNLPTQTSNTGKYLRTDGTNDTWEDLDLGDKISSNTSADAGSTQVSNILKISQADYEALITPVTSTLYVIVG